MTPDTATWELFLVRQMVDGVTLDLTTQHVTGATALPTLCRSLGQHWNDTKLAETVRLALRSSGLLTVDNIRKRSCDEMEQVFASGDVAASVIGKLERALRYSETESFKFACRAVERGAARGAAAARLQRSAVPPQRAMRLAAPDDEDDFSAASPGTAHVMAAAHERGRWEARAARHAAVQQREREEQQLEAEANKWAPGGAAMRELAQDFLNPDADARLTRVVSPARVPGGEWHLRCAAQHALSHVEAAARALDCDVPGCRAKIALGAPHLACAACDHDVCALCATVTFDFY